MLPPPSTSLTSAPRNWPLQSASPKLSSLTPSYHQLVSANGRHSKALGTRKKNQPWIVIERTDAEVEAPILWPPDSKSQLMGKDSDAGKDWRQEKRGMTKDEMVGWHHWFNGHEFEQTLGDSGGQGSLACCSPGGCQESDMTEQLNNNNNSFWVLSLLPWLDPFRSRSPYGFLLLLVPKSSHSWQVSACSVFKGLSLCFSLLSYSFKSAITFLPGPWLVPSPRPAGGGVCPLM